MPLKKLNASGKRASRRGAGAVLYLLSDLAAWVTGQLIPVDGGASIRPGYLDEAGLPVFVRDPVVRKKILGQKD